MNEAAGVQLAGGVGADPSTRAQELRATLGAIVEEAQGLSEQLLAESREAAAATTRDAQDRADAVLARARADAEQISGQARAAADAVRARAEAEVEEYRRRVRAEVTEQVTRQVNDASRRDLAQVRAQSHAVIADLEASVRILGVSLESAIANISDMLSALESLRTHLVDPEADPSAAAVVDVDPPAFASAATTSGPMGGPPTGSPIQRIEREPAFADQASPRASVPDAPSVFDEAGLAAAGQVVQTADPSTDAPEETPPLTATEAFLRSSQLERDLDLELVPAEVARVRDQWPEAPDPDEADESAHGEAERRGPEPVPRPGGDPGSSGDEAGKTLGWLFRSPQ